MVEENSDHDATQNVPAEENATPSKKAGSLEKSLKDKKKLRMD
jgi:hypothetical protein